MTLAIYSILCGVGVAVVIWLAIVAHARREKRKRDGAEMLKRLREQGWQEVDMSKPLPPIFKHATNPVNHAYKNQAYKAAYRGHTQQAYTIDTPINTFASDAPVYDSVTFAPSTVVDTPTFGGGDSGGAGATDSWSASPDSTPSCDTSSGCDSSSGGGDV